MAPGDVRILRPESPSRAVSWLILGFDTRVRIPSQRTTKSAVFEQARRLFSIGVIPALLILSRSRSAVRVILCRAHDSGDGATVCQCAGCPSSQRSAAALACSTAAAGVAP
jgi:hypothetical protein